MKNREKKKRSERQSDTGLNEATIDALTLKTNKLNIHKQNLRYEEAMYGSDSDEDSAFMHIKNANKSKQSGTWIKEVKADEPVDFLDPKVISKVVSTDPSKFKREEDDNSDFDIGENGKLMINDAENSNDDDSAMEEDGDESDEEEEEEVDDVKKRKRGSEFFDYHGNKNINTKKQKNDLGFKFTGDQFKSKKAGGDVKKKEQKYEPFAYMPLQRKNLNKRNKSKTKTQFKAIVSHKAKR